MQRWTSLVGAGALALCASVQAQSPNPSSQSPQPGQPGASASQSEQGEVTATGCLARADSRGSSSESAAPGASASSAGGGFVLKNATIGTSGSSGAGVSASSPGSAGSTAGAGAGAASGRGMGGREIRLMASSGVNLEEHVGHQVEVRGKLSSVGSASTGPSSTSTTPPRESGAGTPAGASGGETMTVSSVRMVSASCTPGSN
jgi:hypothetical protein